MITICGYPNLYWLGRRIEEGTIGNISVSHLWITRDLRYVERRVRTVRCTTRWWPREVPLSMVVTDNRGRETHFGSWNFEDGMYYFEGSVGKVRSKKDEYVRVVID